MELLMLIQVPVLVGQSDALDVFSGNSIYGSAHSGGRFQDCLDRCREAIKGTTELEKLSFFSYPYPTWAPHGVFQFRLPFNQAQGLVYGFHRIVSFV
jgi:hypothetical protein